MHAPSFSLPQAAPLKVVPAGHTLASGLSPQSLSSQALYETGSSPADPLQLHEPPVDAHWGVADVDEAGTSPQVDALQGTTKLRASCTVFVVSGTPGLSPVPPPLASPVDGVALEHAVSRRAARTEKRVV